jgi:predicted nucleic-acid-binding protein
MIGLDTNILARYFLLDDPVQSARAVEIIEGQLSSDRLGYISVVTLAELSWLLLRRYNLSRTETARILERIIASESFSVQNEREVMLAIEAIADNSGDFADALIGALNRAAGCDTTYTFDRKAARLGGFTLA